MTDLSCGWRDDLAAEQRLIERVLRQELNACRPIPDRLRRAMAHSLFGGGKRLRPVLCLWTWDALGGLGVKHREAVPRRIVARAAAALEMVHTYSLIHDDLPAMDDDVLRRGRPTCHVQFDEGTAVLAGDGLLTLAFGILSTCGPRASRLVSLTAKAAGPAGMVGGQQRDLDAEGRQMNAMAIRRIHEGKTASMLALSLTVGGICRALDDASVERLWNAGRHLGLAFQGTDDLLDVTSNQEMLGKTPGKDAACGKATWVRLEGPEAAWSRTLRLGRRGTRELASLLPSGRHAERLLSLSRYMYHRNH